MSQDILPATDYRVNLATDEEINERIRREMTSRVRQLAVQGRGAIDRRLKELDHEWDIERTLEANAATIGLTSLLLGATVDRRFALLSAVVSGFLLQHALQGWCPPLPVFRRMGVRTTKEINEERMALKAIRGDFEKGGGGGMDAAGALEAARQ